MLKSPVFKSLSSFILVSNSKIGFSNSNTTTFNSLFYTMQSTEHTKNLPPLIAKMAPRDGLEPPTQWLTATCSTDWAIEEHKYIVHKMKTNVKNFFYQKCNFFFFINGMIIAPDNEKHEAIKMLFNSELLMIHRQKHVANVPSDIWK